MVAKNKFNRHRIGEWKFAIVNFSSLQLNAIINHHFLVATIDFDCHPMIKISQMLIKTQFWLPSKTLFNC
jgi:hypothetical protein